MPPGYRQMSFNFCKHLKTTIFIISGNYRKVPDMVNSCLNPCLTTRTSCFVQGHHTTPLVCFLDPSQRYCSFCDLGKLKNTCVQTDKKRNVTQICFIHVSSFSISNSKLKYKCSRYFSISQSAGLLILVFFKQRGLPSS